MSRRRAASASFRISDDTALARGPRRDGDPFAASSPPIYQTATFCQPWAAGGGEYDYTRSGNPTRDLLEEELARLERAGHAFAYASGIAAVAAAVRCVAGGGGEVIAGDDLYGGSYRLLSRLLEPEGIGVRYVDLTDPAALASAIGPRTRLVLAESPTNPLLRVVDLPAIARLTRGRSVTLAVDATLLTPLRLRPLELGADLVIHSATKALGGHGDVTAGVVATSDPELAERLAFRRNAEGTALAPFEAWLLLRGMKTLALRLDRQEGSARRIAAALSRHPAVKRLHAPMLPGAPGHALLAAQAKGGGMVVSFETGDTALSARIVDSLELFSIAVSFGGLASSASLPCRMSHASIPEEVRKRRRLPEDLVRLSIGIEEPDDLLADLAAAFDSATGGTAVMAETA